MFHCARAKDVWKALGLYEEVHKAIMQDRSGSITLEIIYKLQLISGDISSVELALVVAWFLWWQRRQWVKGEEVQSPEKSTICIKVLATNLISASKLKIPKRKWDHMWKKPVKGLTKISVDASFSAETLSRATRVVARDDHMNFIVAASWFVPHVSGIDLAEILAIRNGLYLAATVVCNKLVKESDSSCVIDAVKGEDGYSGPDVLVIMDASNLLVMGIMLISCIPFVWPMR